MSSNPADAKQPSATDRLLKVATHQAQNLETIKNEAPQVKTSLQAIDAQALQSVVELKAINRKLGHLVFWVYAWSILFILGFLLSLVLGGGRY